MTWQTTIALALVGLVGWGCSEGRSADADAPPPEGPEVLQRMIEAHGGMEAWTRHGAVEFTHVLYMNFLDEGQNRWWIARQTVERSNDRRVHLNMPLDDAVMAYDGDVVWSKGWTQLNPPGFMPYFDYYFVFMPWLSQDGRLVFEAPATGRLPDDDTEYVTVRATFDPSRLPVGISPRDWFELYIDPETYELRGLGYAKGYEPFIEAAGMDPGSTYGPMLHVFDETTDVDGLLVPSRMHTIGPGGSQAGDHAWVGYAFRDAIDPERLERPEGAEIDSTVPDRSVAAR